jgi:hypothetical protein
MKYRQEARMHLTTTMIEAVAAHIRKWCQATGNAFTAAGSPLLDDQTVAEIARDCGMSDDDLRLMMRAGEHSADEMILLMRAMDLDPAKVEAASAAEFRQMQVTCTRCGEKARCRHALVGDHAFEDVASFCGNAEDLLEMQRRRDLQPA